MNPLHSQIDVVISHYNKAKKPHIRFMTLHAVAHLCRESCADLNVNIVDGSPTRDDHLAEALTALGVKYVHCGRELSFGETYNTGIRRTSCPVVVTLANDIFINPNQIRKLADEIVGRVGCAMPYLTHSDFGAQQLRRFRLPRRCFPTRMTLNVNAFSRAALERVGLIPENMSGCYNDVVLFLRLREEGYSILLRNVGRVIHLAQQTLKSGATSVNYDADEALFSREYPQYWRNGVVLFHKAAQGRLTRLMYGALERLPPRWTKKLRLWRLAWEMEPYLCAERGTFKEGLFRALRRSRPADAAQARGEASRT